MNANISPTPKNAMGHPAVRITAMIPRHVLQHQLGYDSVLAPKILPHVSVAGVGSRSVSLLWLNACESPLASHTLTISINGVEWGCVRGGEPSIKIDNLQPQSDYDILLVVNAESDASIGSSNVRIQTSIEEARSRAQSGQSSDNESVSSRLSYTSDSVSGPSRSRSNTPPDLLKPLTSIPSVTSEPNFPKSLYNHVESDDADGRLNVLKRQESELQQQIKLESQEAETLHDQLRQERSELRLRIKDREDRCGELRRKCNASDKLFRTAQNRRVEKERVLQQKGHERDKRQEQAARWATDVATLDQETLRLKQNASEVSRSQDAHTIRTQAAMVQQSQRGLEDDIRRYGTQIKELEKQQHAQQVLPREEEWQHKQEEMQVQLLSMWQMLQQAQTEEQIAQERLTWHQAKSEQPTESSSMQDRFMWHEAKPTGEDEKAASTNGVAMSPAADNLLPAGLLFDEEPSDLAKSQDCPQDSTDSAYAKQAESPPYPPSLDDPPMLGSLRRSQTQSMPRSVGRRAVFDWDSSPPAILRSQTDDLRDRESPMSRRRTGSGRSFQMEMLKHQIPRSSFEVPLSRHERMSSQPGSPFSFDAARLGEGLNIWAEPTSKRSSGSQCPAPYWTQGLGTWCRRDRSHLSHGSGANLSISSTPLDMDDILETVPGHRAEQAPIGTRPASSKSNGLRLNPAAPSFQTLLNEDAASSLRSTPADSFTLLTGSRTVHVNKNEEAASPTEASSLMQRISRKGSAGKFVVPWAKDRSTPPVKQVKSNTSTPSRSAKHNKKGAAASSSRRPTSSGVDGEPSSGRTWTGMRRKSKKTVNKAAILSTDN